MKEESQGGKGNLQYFIVQRRKTPRPRTFTNVLGVEVNQSVCLASSGRHCSFPQASTTCKNTFSIDIRDITLPMAPKKSFFSKPSWAAKAAAPVGLEQPIFQQNVYEDILEVSRKKEEKRLARQKQREEERRRNVDSRDTKLDQDDKPVKKQRISTEPIPIPLADGDDDFDRRRSDSDSDRSVRSSGSRERRDSSPERASEQPVLRSTPRKDKQTLGHLEYVSPRKPRRATTPLHADDDDDFAIVDVQPAPAKPDTKEKPKPPPPPESESDPEEDEYLRELKRQARAESKAKKTAAFDQRQAGSPATDKRSPSLNPPLGTATSASTTPTPGGPDLTDPEVQILIKSIIPNCDPLIVKRRASQPLSQVLAFYVEKHQLGYLGARLFFTWNGTKLYKNTTMWTILAMIKARYGTKTDGTDLAEGRIEIEAVTEEIHENRQAFKERERKRMANGGQDHDSPSGHDQDREVPMPDECEPPQRSTGTIIQLSSNDEASLPNMKLRVHPHTTIEKIVRGYKRKMGVDMNRPVYLVFDGDKLEEDQTVADVGFEEGDAVDVRAKS